MKYMLFVLMMLFSTSAHAQTPLNTALKAFAVASAVDNTQTFLVLRGGGVEANPLLSMGHNKPVPTVALNAASDVGSFLLWRKIGKEHPKVAIMGLVATTTFRAYVISHNFQTMKAMR